MGKDFHAAFSNMNKAVRPGVGKTDVEKKKLTQAEKILSHIFLFLII